MILTQAQANAIAEREMPRAESKSRTDPSQAEGWAMVDNLLILQRIGYAKCLMSMNPLIEAATRVQNFMDRSGVSYESAMRRDLRTALSNLTKNIEP